VDEISPYRQYRGDFQTLRNAVNNTANERKMTMENMVRLLEVAAPRATCP
jgi:hypothetical protein